MEKIIKKLVDFGWGKRILIAYGGEFKITANGSNMAEISEV